jgi:hypothetical protein
MSNINIRTKDIYKILTEVAEDSNGKVATFAVLKDNVNIKTSNLGKVKGYLERGDLFYSSIINPADTEPKWSYPLLVLNHDSFDLTNPFTGNGKRVYKFRLMLIENIKSVDIFEDSDASLEENIAWILQRLGGYVRTANGWEHLTNTTEKGLQHLVSLIQNTKRINVERLDEPVANNFNNAVMCVLSIETRNQLC